MGEEAGIIVVCVRISVNKIYMFALEMAYIKTFQDVNILE